jgi:hypothetical protein
MTTESTRGRSRKKDVVDSKTVKKKTTKKKTTSTKDKVKRVRDFAEEIQGEYSPEHLVAKLKRIRDASIDIMLECAESAHFKGSLAALQLYEGACRNLDREEAIARGETPGGDINIEVSVPGLNAKNIVIAGQPGKQ